VSAEVLERVSRSLQDDRPPRLDQSELPALAPMEESSSRSSSSWRKLDRLRGTPRESPVWSAADTRVQVGPASLTQCWSPQNSRLKNTALTRSCAEDLPAQRRSHRSAPWGALDRGRCAAGTGY